MTSQILEQLTRAVSEIPTGHRIGRVKEVSGSNILVAGLADAVMLGDSICVRGDGAKVMATVVRLDQTVVEAMIEGPADGIALNAAVEVSRKRRFAPDISWVGRIIDPDGRPLDGRPLLPGTRDSDRNAAPPAAHARRGLGARLETGLAVFNTLLPLVRGQRIGLFAGSGVGKSTLIADLARGVEADVVVIGLVGERGRELRHFVDEVLGPDGMKRAVVVAATSDRSAKLRRRCALSATAVAEHFRAEGLHVLLLIDSVTRFCEAHREVAVVGGEPANLRGFPASTMGAVAGLCERAGPGTDGQGDITAVYSVLVAGSDMEEPVADMLRGVLDGHVVLDREIAERGRFPAVNVLRSVSRALPAAADRIENGLIAEARHMMGTWDRASLMVQSGLYENGSDPDVDAAILCQTPIEKFLSTKDKRDSRAHFAELKRALSPEA